MTDRYCSDYEESTSYPSLEVAKAACDNDRNCGWVYDEFCNDEYYYICPRSTKTKISDKTVRSCIYRKGIFIVYNVYLFL